MNAVPSPPPAQAPAHKIASIQITQHRLTLDPPFHASWDSKPRTHFDATLVRVSTDSGLTWAQAEFLDPVQRYTWRRWMFDWVTPKRPGQYTLLSRAKDANGNVQPYTHDEKYAAYVINHMLPIEVTVEDRANRST